MEVYGRRKSEARVLCIPRLFLISLLAIFLAACGGGGSGDNGGGGGENPPPTVGTPAQNDPEGADLSSTSLASDRAKSLNYIEVQGLSDEIPLEDTFAEFHALATNDSGDSVLHGVLPLFSLPTDPSDEDSETGIFLPTPLVDDDEPASLVVVITDGKSRSRAMQLDLDALPPRDEGIFHEVVDEIDNLLRASTEALGKTYPDEWEGWRDNSLNQIPAYLLPIMLTWHGVMDPENENSISRQLQDGLNPDTLLFLERFLAGSRLPAAIREQADLVAEGDSPLTEAGQQVEIMSSSISWTQPAAPLTMQAQTLVVAQNIPAFETIGVPPLPDSESLAPLLALQRDFRRRQESAELFDDTVGSYLSAVGLVATVAAVAGSGGSAGVAANTARAKSLDLATNAITGFTKVNEVARWFLPCCITDMTTTLTPPGGQVLEDASVPQVRLASATGRAESIGVDVTKEVFTAIGEELTSQTIGNVFNTAYSDFGEGAGDIANYFLSDLTEDIIGQFPPGQNVVFVWDDIDLMGAEAQKWLEVEIDTFGSGGEPMLYQANTTSDRFEFGLLAPRAFDIQSSQLRFSTNNETLVSSPAIHTSTVNLRYIALEFSPSSLKITKEDLGTSMEFSVTVKNSALHDRDFPFIDWILEPEPAIGEVFYVREEPQENPNTFTHTFRYVVPDEFPEGTIVEVRTESISNSSPAQNLRAPANNPPPRENALFISADVVNIVVDPPRKCMAPGSSHQFRALDDSTDEEVEVNWAASNGSINGSGVFTAGSPGDALVTARPAEGIGTTRPARVTVGDCTCYFNAELSGGTVSAAVSRAGFSYLSLGRDDTTHNQLRFFGQEDSADNLTGMLLDLDPALVIGASGTVSTTTRSSGFINGESYVLFGPDGPLPALTVDITSRTPLALGAIGSVALEGRIYGSVNVARNEAPPDNFVPAFLNIEFNGIYSIVTAGPALNCDPDR
ncbi:hypothetical protein [Marinobacter sp.]|uniref:hypothetical protein n=1 Tax=Marinobacter sp. TaxID=50741 RepID=UPI002B4A9A09|nr:hypothetical protein [Marinobacter sp.]HKK56185.1 hypothetical protein [Marinobacter sp.]